MCGRFVVARATSDLLPDLLAEFPGLSPNYNVAPSTKVAAVRSRDGQRTLEEPHWGFVPTWAKDWAKQRPKPINARIETVATSPMFRKSFATARVLVPASGYIEWTVTHDGKQPNYIHDAGDGLAMAGILSFWPDPTKAEDAPEKWRESVAIITRDAHVTVAETHDRMPALLPPDLYDDWLSDGLDPKDLLEVLAAGAEATSSSLRYYEVGTAINNVRNNGEELIAPLR